MFDKATIEFIKEHIGEDPSGLVLAADKYPEIDVKGAAQQISARNKAKDKLKEWYNNLALLFPAPVSVEQSSSAETAIYKQIFCDGGAVADITGGFGADCYYLSKVSESVDYYEQNASLCEIAKHNFKILNALNININAGSFLDATGKGPIGRSYSLIYADPSRRGKGGKRVLDPRDYEPYLPKIMESLFEYSDKVLIKISPMADISAALALFPDTSEVHIVSVKNECKELLFLTKKECKCNNPVIKAVNINSELMKHSCFIFLPSEEKKASAKYSASDKFEYLYEPGASVLKAGAFKLISERFGIDKLHKGTHLYSSDKFLEDFPGRIFRVIEIVPFTKNNIKTFKILYPKINVVARNFPLTTEELRHRLSTADGGEQYVFGVSAFDKELKLIVCERLL